MRTLNLGILAHVDAGKTSLTERLLHSAGVIDEIGSVDDGSTQTDSMALERQRGITIKSAVVSFVIDDVTVNLIDTPGHPDFIAEVERVLSVLDGVVLVISAVEGVQAQTRVLMRVLKRLRIPTLIFVNKIDRRGARYDDLLRSISAKLTPAIVAMGAVDGLGTRGAVTVPPGAGFASRLVDLLADTDDALLAAYVEDEASVSYSRLRAELAAQTKGALVHPVFFGSAITGAGVDSLITGVRELLPAAEADTGGPVSGTVFKVERGPAGEKIAYVRMFSGTVRVSDRLPFGPDKAAKVTAISVFDRGSAVPHASVVSNPTPQDICSHPHLTAGQIGRLWGLGDIRIGDNVGIRRTSAAHHVLNAGPARAESGPAKHVAHPHLGEAHPLLFSPPTLETVVTPCRTADRGALHVALSQLAEQDPLIGLRRDEIRQEISVSLYGEVQKEVIQATLADDFGLDVTFRETTTICVERPVGIGAAHEKDPDPFLATVGLRVEPAPVGSGVDFRLEVELGSMPYTFFRAVEETVRETLRQGINGWQVTDCTVFMTHSGYWPRQSHSHAVFDKSMSSTAGDFRNLTPLVLMSALRHAGTLVYEPMHRFHLEAPADTLGSVLPVLGRLRAVPRTPAIDDALFALDGDVPAAKVHELEQLLPSLTRGEGILECAFDHYRQVQGRPPSRPRTDHNPLNRKEYFQHVVRRT